MDWQKRILDFDTLLVLEEIFPLEHQAEAEGILATGVNTPLFENLNRHTLNRIRLAALKLSEGNIEGLTEAVKIAQTDWRDLLMWSGFGESVDAAEEWAKSIRQKAPNDRLAKFRLLIRAICVRPAMYVGSNNFVMVHAYIDGYLFGLSQCQNGDFEREHLNDFRVWCAEKFETCKGHWLVEPIRKLTTNDDEAFEQLFLLHEEFYKWQLKAK